MTVSSTTTKVSYSGNGSTTAFAYTFKIFATSELEVIIRSAAGAETVKSLTTHYSVSGAGAAGGGNVTFGSAPASGETVIIRRKLTLTQGTDYVENDPFPASSHEDALDRLTFITQQMQDELDRSIKASTSNTITTPAFTEAASDRASKFLGFDATGNAVTITTGPISDAEISSPSDAQLLIYDNGDSRWENKSVSGDIAITAAGVSSIASGVIVNADVNASAAIADSKLATISTADKVSGAAIQVDGATDGSSITIADADKFLVDDGGTTKYVTASQINAYTSAAVAADDIGTGDAAINLQTSSGNVLVDSQAGATTVDGHTGVTLQSTNSGDILLDSVADITLDAAGNDIALKAGGTQFGALTNSSSDLVVEAKVQDKDILFKGDDGGSGITALSLDMSDAGKATFASGVVVGGDVDVSGGARDILMVDNNAAALEIAESSNKYLTFVTTDSGEKITLGKKLEAGSVEIEGTAFDIDGGDISAATISGGLTWSAAQNLNRKNLTYVDFDSGTVDGATVGANSASTVKGTTITATTAVVPDASGGADLGSAALEWGDVYIADDKKLQLGSYQDFTIEYDENGNDTTAVVAANGLSMAPHGTSSGNTTELRFQELAANGANYIGFKGPDAIGSNIMWTLPNADGSDGQVLKTDGSAALSWVSAAAEQSVATSATPTFAGVNLGNSTLNHFVDWTSWTPAITFGGGNTGIGYDQQIGQYCRIHDVCYFAFSITLSSKGSSSGDAKITSFPFTIHNDNLSNGFSLTIGYSKAIDLDAGNAYYSLAMQPSANEAIFNLIELGDNKTPAAITDADFANDSRLRAHGFYRIN